MMYQVILSFLTPALLVLAATPLVITLAKKIGAIDLPNERKVHKQPIPRLGGVAVCAGFLFAFLFLYYAGVFTTLPDVQSTRTFSFILALAIVFAVGIADDLQPISPGKKFLVQLLAATIVYVGGFRISTITSFTAGETFNLGAIDYPLTVLWIAGITNAFNLIDGLDGLASGVGIISALFMFVISYLGGNIATALIMLMLAGAITGFLRYNFNPAKIFLGDSGSLLIGFSLAVLSIQTSTKGSTAFALSVPILALGLPIIDTLLSMIRRLLQSFLPGEKSNIGILSKLHSMFMPDRKHIHHQLISLGLSHRSVVLVLYVVSMLLGIGALFVTVSNNTMASIIIASVGIAMAAGIRQLRYKEMAILSNGIFLPMYEWPIMQERMFQGFTDLIASASAFTLAFVLTHREGIPVGLSEFFLSITTAAGVQLAACASCGLYKSSFRYAGIGEMLKIIKAGVLSVAAAGFVLSLFAVPWLTVTPMLLIVDFYLLVSFIAGTRMSYNVFNFLFQKTNKNGRNVLIYGARANGILTLHFIRNAPELELNPIGFLDDDPSLQAKDIGGLKVFGGHWMLKRILRKYEVSEILIASDTLKPEVFHRLKQFADEFKISVKRRRVFFEEIPVEPLRTPEVSFESTLESTIQISQPQ